MASPSPSHSHALGQASAVGQGDDHHLTNPIPGPRQPLAHDVFSHPPVPSWKRGRLHGFPPPPLPPHPLLPLLRLSPRESIVGFDHAVLQGEIDSKSPTAPSQLEAQSLPNRTPHTAPGPSDDGGDSKKLPSATPSNPPHASDEPIIFDMDEFGEIEQQPSLSPSMHPPLTRKDSEETLVNWPSAR